MSKIGKLPRGYLSMGSDEYAMFDVETQRAIYAELRDIVRYHIGREEADRVIAAKNPQNPVEWIMAVKSVRYQCRRCGGSGTYYWGACINGKMTHSAPCARCGGKGWMDFEDMRRSRAYDNYAICRAAGY